MPDFQEGKIENGGMDRRIVTHKWVEPGQYGKVVLVVNEEGTRMNGIWGYGDNLKNYGIWVFRKKTTSPSLCYTANYDKSIKVDQMKSDLIEKGKLIIYGINFEFNSSIIKPESYSVLNDIGELLKKNSSLKINIEGHTDDVGSDDFNQALSLKRAQSVKSYLVSKMMILESRIQTNGKGEKYPIADNNSSLGKAANRRVEISPIQ
jgi:outer membrane protein OmpA-like peptidoglycan-associated protein